MRILVDEIAPLDELVPREELIIIKDGHCLGFEELKVTSDERILHDDSYFQW
jgi:hypothetical protein